MSVLDSLERYGAGALAIGVIVVFILSLIKNYPRILGWWNGHSVRRDSLEVQKIKAQLEIERDELKIELERIRSQAKENEQRHEREKLQLTAMQKQSDASAEIAKHLSTLTMETRGMNQANAILIQNISGLTNQLGTFIETVTTQNKEAQSRHEQAIEMARSQYDKSVNTLKTNEMALGEIIANLNIVIQWVKDVLRVMNSDSFTLEGRGQLIDKTVKPYFDKLFIHLGIYVVEDTHKESQAVEASKPTAEYTPSIGNPTILAKLSN